MCNCSKPSNLDNKFIKTKNIISKLWENSQKPQMNVIIKKINK